MAYATRTYTPGSSTTTFALTTAGGSPIGYIQESDISVKVNGTTYTNAASGTNTYQISGTTTVEQPNGGNVVLNAGVTGTVILERNTAIQTATVVYTAGSTLTSTDLNNADNQIRFGLQEFSDDYAALNSTSGTLPNLLAFLGSSDTWVSNNSRAATTAAIDGRVGSLIDTALTTDVSGGDGVTIVDNSPGAGQIRVDLDADIATLRNMQSGAAAALALLTSAEIEILDGASLSTTELNYVDGVTSAIQTQLNAKQPLATDLTNLSSCQSNASSALAALTQAEVQILDGATVSTTELNLLDGVPGTLTTTEIGYLDGVTSAIQTQLDTKQTTNARLTAIGALDANDSNIIVGDGTTWVAENGATARTSLGAQAAAADLTNLSSCQSGATAAFALLTSTEVAILDGATPSTTELNYVDGVTSAIQGQLDGKQPLDAELTTLSGMTSNTASVLADNTASLGATLAEINSICENRGSQTTITNSDAHIPTSGAVVDYVTGSVSAVGGLIAIATDAAFPATASQPANGVVVSISNAGGMVISSNSSTTGRTTDGTPATVTVNTFPNALNGETLTDGVGLQVVSTGSNNTYTYQKLLVKEADVIQLSDDINEFNERYRTDNTGNNPTSNNHAGDLFFNQGTNTMLVRNAANNAWQEVQSSGDFYINTFASLGNAGDTVPGGSATPNGTAQKFTLSNAGSVTQQHLVSVNGVVQQPSSSGSVSSAPSNGFVVDGSALVLASAPPSGATLFVVTIGASVNIGAPSANTVGANQLQSAAVTDAKVATNAAIAVSKLADFTANDANNRVLTATGTKNSYNGEANLTFDGNLITGTHTSGNIGLELHATGSGIGNQTKYHNDHGEAYIGQAGDTTGNLLIHNTSNTHILFATNNAERLRLTDGGNVGIGTTSPNAKFQVNDTNPVIAEFHHSDGGDNDEARIALGAYSSNPPSQRGVTLVAKNNSAGHDFIVNTSSSHSLGPTEKLRVDSSGRLLLGTTTEGNSYADNLTVSDSSHCGITIRSGTTAYGTIYFSDATSGGDETDGFVEYKHDDRFLRIGTAQTERLRIDSSGKIGFNTATISEQLHSHKTDSTENYLRFTNTTTGTAAGDGFNVGINGDEWGMIWQKENLGIMFGTNGSERLRIDAAGMTGVRTTVPRATLHVKAHDNAWESGLLLEDNTGDDGWNLHPDSSDTSLMIGYNDDTTAALTSQSATPIVRFRSAGGICFGSDTAASTALDDYEEGTHEFSIQGGGSNPSSENFDANHRDIHYIKIGNLVHCWGELRWAFTSGNFGSGQFRITLPFASANIEGNNQAKGVCQFWNVNWKNGQTNADNIHTEISNNKSYMTVRRSEANSTTENHLDLGTSTFQTANAGLGTEMDFAITYRSV